MTYKEILTQARHVLFKWKEVRVDSAYHWFSMNGDCTQFILDLADDDCWREGSKGTLSVLTLQPKPNYEVVQAFSVEEIFANPFKATKEEAELFKLEHGFNYPEELVCGV